MDLFSEIKIAIVEPSRELIERNLRSAYDQMEQKVRSGATEREFGQKYSESSLQEFCDRMDFDVQELVPGSFVFRPEMREAFNKWLGSLLNLKSKSVFHRDPNREFVINTHHYNSSTANLSELFILDRRERFKQTHLKNFVESILNRIYFNQIPGTITRAAINLKVDYEVAQGADLLDNHFTFKVVQGDFLLKRKVKAVVTTTHPDLPVAQEEYLHAAQELSFGSVAGTEYLDPLILHASNNVTHASILLDRILSAAAAEMGPEEFEYWATRADEVTDVFKQKAIVNGFATWHRTPFSKDVNKRFRYPIVNYREIGAILVDRSENFDRFMFYEDGTVNPNAQSLFEILSLQFGVQHRDLTYQMYDLAETNIKTDEDIERMGEKAVEWGKKMLQFHKGRPSERELVTHHSNIEDPIDENQFEYESTRVIVRELNQRRDKDYMIPTAIITLDKLANLMRENASKKIAGLLTAIFPIDPNRIEIPSKAVLDQYNLTYQQFTQIIRTARKLYIRHLQSVQN